MADPAAIRAAVVQTALDQVGKPYVWGGASPKQGFDCSGLVSYAYGVHGIDVPHNSEEAWAAGQVVDRAEVADPVFFHGSCSGSEVPPCHEALYIGGGRVVVAPHTGAVVQVASLGSFNDYLGARAFVPQTGAQDGPPPPSSSSSSSSGSSFVSPGALGCMTLVVWFAVVCWAWLALVAGLILWAVGG